MARQVLVIDEVLAILHACDAPESLIRTFLIRAEALWKRGRRDVDDVQVSSGFGAKSRKGTVDLVVNDQVTQMEPVKARQIGLFLLEAAEAAVSDEIFIKLLTNLGIEDTGRLSAILLDLRELRQGTKGVSFPS